MTSLDFDFDFDFDFDLFFRPTCAFYALFHPINDKREEVLIHIATAGGRIPSYVYSNIFNHTVRHELKNNREELRGEVRINPDLESILGSSLDINLGTDIGMAIDLYTHDFSEYAKRNCFSFDRTNISHPLMGHYHLVAAPPDEDPNNKIPSNKYPYLFSFRQCRGTVFLILMNFNNIFGQTDLNVFTRPNPHVIGYSPFKLI